MTEQVKKKRVFSPKTEFEHKMAEEKLKAQNEPFEPKPSNEWISTKDWWSKSTEEEKRDTLFGLACYAAAKPKQIAKYYGIKTDDLKPYAEQLAMGEAARTLKIQSHQMHWALGTNVPNAKFFLGLQFAGQVQNPLHDDAPSLDEKKDSSISITVIGKDTVNGTSSIHDSVSGEDHVVQ